MLVLFSKCSPGRCGNAATEIMQQPFSPLFVFFGCKAPLEYPQNLLLFNKTTLRELGADLCIGIVQILYCLDLSVTVWVVNTIQRYRDTRSDDEHYLFNCRPSLHSWARVGGMCSHVAYLLISKHIYISTYLRIYSYLHMSTYLRI